jgi:ceramide glucosyltransferase
MAVRNGWYFTWRSPFLFALRDLMLPAVYVDAWLLDDFVWRGNAMSVREEERPST